MCVALTFSYFFWSYEHWIWILREMANMRLRKWIMEILAQCFLNIIARRNVGLFVELKSSLNRKPIFHPKCRYSIPFDFSKKIIPENVCFIFHDRSIHVRLTFGLDSNLDRSWFLFVSNFDTFFYLTRCVLRCGFAHSLLRLQNRNKIINFHVIDDKK